MWMWVTLEEALNIYNVFLVLLFLLHSGLFVYFIYPV